MVGDIRQDSPASPLAQTMYVPVAQHSFRAADMQIVVRTGIDPATMAATLEPCSSAAIRRSPSAPPPCARRSANPLAPRDSGPCSSAAFAGVAILLAAVGMYGVTAYTVAQRRFEFALRFALGANRTQIVTMTLAHGVAVASVGIGFGVALSLALLRTVGNFLGKLPAFDPASYAIAILGVLAIAISAAIVPCRRASQVEPMRVLRGD